MTSKKPSTEGFMLQLECVETDKVNVQIGVLVRHRKDGTSAIQLGREAWRSDATTYPTRKLTVYERVVLRTAIAILRKMI